MPDTSHDAAYGVTINGADARHATLLQLLDGLHDRITTLETTQHRQDVANRIYAGIATSSTLVSFAALGIALNAWLVR